MLLGDEAGTFYSESFSCVPARFLRKSYVAWNSAGLNSCLMRQGQFSSHRYNMEMNQYHRAVVRKNYYCSDSAHKQLLDEVFVISGIVEVGIISRSRGLRLITLTETLIILDITKTESNNCFIIH